MSVPLAIQRKVDMYCRSHKDETLCGILDYIAENCGEGIVKKFLERSLTEYELLEPSLTVAYQCWCDRPVRFSRHRLFIAEPEKQKLTANAMEAVQPASMPQVVVQPPTAEPEMDDVGPMVAKLHQFGVLEQEVRNLQSQLLISNGEHGRERLRADALAQQLEQAERLHASDLMAKESRLSDLEQKNADLHRLLQQSNTEKTNECGPLDGETHALRLKVACLERAKGRLRLIARAHQELRNSLQQQVLMAQKSEAKAIARIFPLEHQMREADAKLAEEQRLRQQDISSLAEQLATMTRERKRECDQQNKLNRELNALLQVRNAETTKLSSERDAAETATKTLAQKLKSLHLELAQEQSSTQKIVREAESLRQQVAVTGQLAEARDNALQTALRELKISQEKIEKMAACELRVQELQQELDKFSEDRHQNAIQLAAREQSLTELTRKLTECEEKSVLLRRTLDELEGQGEKRDKEHLAKLQELHSSHQVSLKECNDYRCQLDQARRAISEMAVAKSKLELQLGDQQRALEKQQQNLVDHATKLVAANEREEAFAAVQQELAALKQSHEHEIATRDQLLSERTYALSALRADLTNLRKSIQERIFDPGDRLFELSLGYRRFGARNSELQVLEEAAAAGNANASYLLGCEYLFSSRENQAQGLTLLTQAAEHGHAPAQYAIGDMLMKGEWIEANPDCAVEWFAKAAARNFAPAQYALAIGDFNGAKVAPLSTEQVIELITKAAKSGFTDAQFALGVIYDLGELTPRDPKQAAAYYRKAAEQGFIRAQFNMGECYQFGDGVKKDMVKAVAWYTKAAEGGYAKAFFCLGECYERGGGVEQDAARALDYYRRAAELGMPEALKKVETSTSTLGGEQNVLL